MSTVWDLYHLRGTPFFQDPLGDDVRGRLPSIRELFVGREDDVELALRLTTHDTATRMVIVGEPGVGKTTLLNRLRAELDTIARDDATGAPRFLTHSPAISIQSGWTALDFCAEILRTILLMRAGRSSTAAPAGFFGRLSGVFGHATTSPTFWERVAQIVEGRQLVGIGVQGGSMGGQLQTSWAAPTLTPASLLLAAADAIRVATEELGVELVFFLNNLENLSRMAAAHAAGLFQDVRDLFLTNGSHWVVCGTTEVDARVIRASVQVGGIFPAAIRLAPLAPDEVAELLRRRYRALQKDVAPLIPPVEPAVGSQLAGVYRGDLRNFLRLLQDAVLRAVGPRGAAPVTLVQIVAIMGREHAAAIEANLTAAGWRYLRQTVLGSAPGDEIWSVFTQADAARRCGVSAPAFKRHMDQWLARGYVRADRVEGRSEWVRLSGEAAVAFAALALEQGDDAMALLGSAGASTDDASVTIARRLSP